MAIVQLDLFGWNQELTLDAEKPRNTYTTAITVESLSSAFIKCFGHWIDDHTSLLGDDWTIAETLVTIHKVFTREQLLDVSSEMWDAAWGRFNEYYLTKRSRNAGFQLKWWPNR